MVSTREISRFGVGPMAQSHSHLRHVRKQNSPTHMRKTRRRLHSWSRRLARAELRTEQRLYVGEQPDSPERSVYAHQPMKVMRATSVMDPSRPPTVPNKFINHNTIMDAWTKSIMARSLAIFWVGTFTRLVGPVRVPQLAVATEEQKVHPPVTHGIKQL